MTDAIKSTYIILSNKPLTQEFVGIYSEIAYNLPPWFVNWGGKKLIKVYGCSFAYLESHDEKIPVLSQKYANQFISVHSNIVRDDTEHLLPYYVQTKKPSATTDGLPITQEDVENFAGFMIVCNNYFTPKIYDLSNSNETKIIIWFKDSYGNIINIIEPYTAPPVDGVEQPAWYEVYRAVFKIEAELAIFKE
jgi:hypothetical protein